MEYFFFCFGNGIKRFNTTNYKYMWYTGCFLDISQHFRPCSVQKSNEDVNANIGASSLHFEIWSATSPDLNSRIFICGSMLKSIVYAAAVKDAADQQQREQMDGRWYEIRLEFFCACVKQQLTVEEWSEFWKYRVATCGTFWNAGELCRKTDFLNTHCCNQPAQCWSNERDSYQGVVKSVVSWQLIVKCFTRVRT
jgi:hypothetical protein